MMRTFSLLLAAALCSCATEGPPFDLELRWGQGFGSGYMATIGVVQSDGVVLLRESFPVEDDDGMEVTWGALLADGGTYQVFILLDMNQDTDCGQGDLTFVADVGPVDSLVQLELEDLGSTVTACEFFR